MVQSCSIPVSVAKRATKTTLAGRPIKLGKKKRHQPPLALCSLAMPPSSFKAALICELTGWPTLSRRWRVNLRSAENRTPGAVLMDWAMAWWWMSKAFTPSGSSSQTKYPPWGSVIRVPFGKKRSISALATVCWDCNAPRRWRKCRSNPPCIRYSAMASCGGIGEASEVIIFKRSTSFA